MDQAGQVVNVSGSQSYDANQQIMHWITHRDWPNKRVTSRIACRFTDYDELTKLLNAHGFQIEYQYADWDETPFSLSSPSIISVCTKVKR